MYLFLCFAVYIHYLLIVIVDKLGISLASIAYPTGHNLLQYEAIRFLLFNKKIYC